MNEQPIQKSERIASQIMRILAITGLVALLALVAWLIVQGVRYVPHTGNGMSAAVSSISSLFRSAPKENIAFDLTTRTWTEGAQTEVRWTYDGAQKDTPFLFSYTCSNNLLLRVRAGNEWTDVACGNTFEVKDATLVVTPLSPEARFTDTQISITRADVKDETYITIVNTNVPLDIDTTSQTVATTTQNTNATTTTPTAKPAEPKPVVIVTTPTPVVPTPVVSAPKPAPAVVPTVVKPVVRTPADIMVNIEDTGVYLEVAGRDTFFPVSPIPDNKRAAVVFTVTNRGQEASGMWGFVAHLPTEGNPKYRYASPVQASLAPGMQVEFTLGFDDVVDAKTGAIRIELVPGDKSDSAGNNVDATIVKFK